MAVKSSTPVKFGAFGELSVAAVDGYAELKPFGNVSDVFGGGDVLLYRFVGGSLTLQGLRRDDGFVEQTSFFDLYPDFRDRDHILARMRADFSRPHASLPPVDIALFCSHIWDHNYQHFLIEGLPRIWALCNVPELNGFPIVVTDRPHIREILAVSFPDRQFLFLSEGDALPVGTVYYVGAVTRNMAKPPRIVGDALRHFRERVLEQAKLSGGEEGPAGRIAFFGRRPHPSYQGNGRVLTNHAQLEAAIRLAGGEIRDFDGKSLVEKAAVCSDVAAAISPVGANLMNFIFLPLSASILIIEHPVFRGEFFFTHLFQAMGFSPEKIAVFKETTLEAGQDRVDNSRYRLDLDRFGVALEEFLFINECKKLRSDIFIAGLDDGRPEGGLARGLRESTSGTVDHVPLSASNCGMGLWLGEWDNARLARADVAVFDYYVMDYQNDPDYVARDLPLLLRRLARGTVGVVLLWPDRAGMAAVNEIILSTYRAVCEREGALFVDCRPLVRTVQKRSGAETVETMFLDMVRLKPTLGRLVGRLVAARIAHFLHSPRQDGGLAIEALSPDGDDLAGPPWLRVPVSGDNQFRAAAPGRILGMMIETLHRDFEIRVKGHMRRVWTYQDPADPNAPRILRYVSVPSAGFETGEVVTIETYVDGRPAKAMNIASLLVQYDPSAI